PIRPGKVKRNTVWRGSAATHTNSPPPARARARAMVSPRPVPVPPDEKGVKSRSRSSGGMPGPSSSTVSWTISPDCRAERLRRPPRTLRRASSALAATFSTALERARGSARTSNPRGQSMTTWAPLSRAAEASRASRSSRTTERSTNRSTSSGARPARARSESRAAGKGRGCPVHGHGDGLDRPGRRLDWRDDVVGPRKEQADEETGDDGQRRPGAAVHGLCSVPDRERVANPKVRQATTRPAFAETSSRAILFKSYHPWGRGAPRPEREPSCAEPFARRVRHARLARASAGACEEREVARRAKGPAPERARRSDGRGQGGARRDRRRGRERRRLELHPHQRA